MYNEIIIVLKFLMLTYVQNQSITRGFKLAQSKEIFMRRYFIVFPKER